MMMLWHFHFSFANNPQQSHGRQVTFTLSFGKQTASALRQHSSSQMLSRATSMIGHLPISVGTIKPATPCIQAEGSHLEHL
jgi:hypothetical protein